MAESTIRADQVGSQQRPPELQEARASYKQGQISREALTSAEDEAIAATLERQREIGLGVLSDGEFRRDAWTTDIADAFEGFAAEYPMREERLPDGTIVLIETHAKPIVGKLRQRRRIAEHEARFLIDHAQAPFKITMPSPNMIAMRAGIDMDAPYQSREELLGDLLPAYQSELTALAGEGVPYLQIDQTMNRFSTAEAREELASAGEDPERLIAAEVAADNACFDAVSGFVGVTTAKHFCRGSRTRARGEGDYEWFGEHVFPELHADRFLLEYDSDVVGGFEPLRFIPKGKIAVLGLVTSKYPEVEDPDYLIRRIEEASKYCPIEQLAICPQCGFGGAADNNFMTVDEQFRKLENMVAVAERVWGS